MLCRSKLKWIGMYVRGKKILDLGCVCHELDVSNPPWLHGYICKLSDDVLGVDILPEAVEEMNRRGYRAVTADVETMDLKDTFDVIVAGDLVEHLANHGLFLQRAAAHLKPDGVLLLTTPNATSLPRYLRVLTKGYAPAHHQHTCWFTAKVLGQLASRYGLEACDVSFADDSRIHYPLWPSRISQRGGPIRRAWRRTRLLLRRLAWRPALYLNSLICFVRPESAETLCMAFRLAPAGSQAPTADGEKADD
jgi:SAM-dependent methyltransferase